MGTSKGRGLVRLRSFLENERWARAGEMGRRTQCFCGDARVKELSAGDEGDRATYSLLEQFEHLEQRRALSSLRSVENAIRIMDAGRYGICQLCGEPIPSRRLRALPTAVFCVGCQGAAEAGHVGERALGGGRPAAGGSLTQTTRPAHPALTRPGDHRRVARCKEETR